MEPGPPSRPTLLITRGDIKLQTQKTSTHQLEAKDYWGPR